MREKEVDIAKYNCPKGYIPVNRNVQLDDRTLELNRNIIDKYGGIISLKGARCGDRTNNSRYLRGCVRKIYNDDDNLAKCYANQQDSTKITSKYINTIDKTKIYTGIGAVSLCPRNYKDPDAQNKFFSTYCKKNLTNATTNPYCTEWWGSQRNKTVQDDLVKSFCKLPENLNNSKCTCINAPKRSGITDSVRWAYHAPCSETGYRTQDMYNLTIQDCSANMNINALDGNSLDRIKIMQTCEQNVAGGKSGTPSIPGLTDHGIGPNSGSDMNVDAESAESDLTIGDDLLNMFSGNNTQSTKKTNVNKEEDILKWIILIIIIIVVVRLLIGNTSNSQQRLIYQQPPIYQNPVYQNPVYQNPVYQNPIYKAY